MNCFLPNPSLAGPKKKKKIAVLILVAVFALTGTAASFFYFKNNHLPFLGASGTQKTADPHVEFLSEIYDKIKENYWDKIGDEELSNIYKLAAEKLTEKPQNPETKDKEGVKKMAAAIIKDMDTAGKNDFSARLGDIVLANLKPFGRSRLYTAKQEQELANNVQNINPEKDLYALLDLNKGASQGEVKDAFEKKAEELKNNQTAEDKKKLEEISYARDVLSKEDTKKRYDASGAEPTVFSKLVRPDIFYIHLTKMSPTTLEEFQKIADSVSGKKGLNSLILDLRDNVGGAIDLMQYFLGPFIGPGQYAYDFYHQDNYTPFKTKTGWLSSLVQYKKVVILINGGAQSSAEVMAAALKKYNVGILVGEPTKGWGTVERVFDIERQIDPNRKFSALIVHSITLRDDGQPIEGRGVEPLINIKDRNWQSQLMEYFNYPELTKAVKEVWDSFVQS
jgi:hypothetical protein